MKHVESKLGLEHTRAHELTMPQLAKKQVHEQVFHTLAYTSGRLQDYLGVLARNCGSPEACRKVRELKESADALSISQRRLALGVSVPADLAKEIHENYQEIGKQYGRLVKLLREHPELREKYKQKA
jgi:hypothetical protein